MQMKYAQQKQREMGNLLGKTPDIWLLFVTQDYTYSVAKSIGLLFKISKQIIYISYECPSLCQAYKSEIQR